MDCSKCPTYIQTEKMGKLECKKCHHYKAFQVQNTPRPKLIFENLTELIKEACVDTERTETIIDHIKQLPRDMSVPLMMSYALGMSLREIADYHSSIAISNKTKWDRLIKKTAAILRGMVNIPETRPVIRKVKRNARESSFRTFF